MDKSMNPEQIAALMVLNGVGLPARAVGTYSAEADLGQFTVNLEVNKGVYGETGFYVEIKSRRCFLKAQDATRFLRGAMAAAAAEGGSTSAGGTS